MLERKHKYKLKRQQYKTYAKRSPNKHRQYTITPGNTREFFCRTTEVPQDRKEIEKRF